MRRSFSGPITFLAAFLALGNIPASAASETAECTKSAMERDPASVVAPCTALLDKKDLATARRAEVLRVRADGFDRSKRRKEGLADYEASIKLAPRNADTMMSAAWAAWALRDNDRVAALLEQALKVEPGNARAHDLIGFLAMNRGKLVEAIAAFTVALKTDPRQPFALLHRADSYSAIGQTTDALADLTVLTSYKKEELNRFPLRDQHGNPDNFYATAHVMRAQQFLKLGNVKDAIRDYDVAIAELPGFAEGRAVRAYLKMLTGDNDGAMADADGALAINPKAGAALSTKAQILAMRKQYDAGLAVIDKAIEAEPDNGGFWIDRASILRRNGKYEAAADTYVQTYRAFPQFQRSLSRGIIERGYLRSGFLPGADAPELRDAFLACAIDPTCS